MRTNWNVKNGALKIELYTFLLEWYVEYGMALAVVAKAVAVSLQYNIKSMCSFSYTVQTNYYYYYKFLIDFSIVSIPHRLTSDTPFATYNVNTHV